MLNIINNMQVFFEDCYRRLGVREYSRITKISPPTASKILFEFRKQGLLLMEKERNYLLFYSNKENKNFIDLSRIYWNNKLNEIVSYLDANLVNPTIVLFGSLSKGEVLLNSDIDIAVFGSRKEIDLSGFEKKLKRKIQLFFFDSVKNIENKELSNNILNGYILKGRLKL